MNKGTIAWQIANGDTPPNVKNHALLHGLNIPKTGSQRLVGLMVTKTLLFAGDGTNPLLHAYDKTTGEDIAQIPMPGMQTGVPIPMSIRDENWELRIEHWSDQRNLTNAQFSIPNSHPKDLERRALGENLRPHVIDKLLDRLW